MAGLPAAPTRRSALGVLPQADEVTSSNNLTETTAHVSLYKKTTSTKGRLAASLGRLPARRKWLRLRIVRVGQFEEDGNVDCQGISQLLQKVHSGVVCPLLNAADRRAVDIRVHGKVLLSDALLRSHPTKIPADAVPPIHGRTRPACRRLIHGIYPTYYAIFAGGRLAMNIAVGILGLITGLLVLLQACTVPGVSSLSSGASITAAAQFGMFVGLLFFVGGAFGFGPPLVSAMVFTGLPARTLARRRPPGLPAQVSEEARHQRYAYGNWRRSER